MQKHTRQPTTKGPAERFTGDVYVDMVVQSPDAGFSVGAVHFTPGAHTAWHSHAAGQTLHCTEGLGLVVTAEEVIVLRSGDTVWTPPDVRHWHGAAPDHFMAHLAMSAATDPASGTEPVTWQEHVDDAAYLAAASLIPDPSAVIPDPSPVIPAPSPVIPAPSPVIPANAGTHVPKGN